MEEVFNAEKQSNRTTGNLQLKTNAKKHQNHLTDKGMIQCMKTHLEKVPTYFYDFPEELCKAAYETEFICLVIPKVDENRVIHR